MRVDQAVLLDGVYIILTKTLQDPGQSDLFDQVDAQFIRPRLNDALNEVRLEE